MTELREKINDIILSYCEGHYHLEFTEDDLPNILNEIEEAINYNRCCTELKCSGCKKPLNDGLCGSCCSDLASGMY